MSMMIVTEVFLYNRIDIAYLNERGLFVFELILKMIRQVLGAVVHPQKQAPAGVRRH
jgi:hypothetical protein